MTQCVFNFNVQSDPLLMEAVSKGLDKEEKTENE